MRSADYAYPDKNFQILARSKKFWLEISGTQKLKLELAQLRLIAGKFQSKWTNFPIYRSLYELLYEVLIVTESGVVAPN